MKKIEDIPHWPKDMLWSELRDVGESRSEKSMAICNELLKRGASLPDITEICPSFAASLSCHDAGGPDDQSGSLGASAKTSVSDAEGDVAVGLYFKLLFAIIVAYLIYAWASEQSSVSGSLGEAAGKVSKASEAVYKPMREELEKFRDGFRKGQK